MTVNEFNCDSLKKLSVQPAPNFVMMVLRSIAVGIGKSYSLSTSSVCWAAFRA